MSSEDDEFFDAPDAFTCSSHVRRWSDNEDELVRSTFDFENKNVERRNRVESLKKGFAEHSHPVASHIQQAAGNTTSRTSLTDDNVFLHALGSPENKAFLPVYTQTQDAPIGSALLATAHPQELGDRPWLSHRSFLQASENVSAISERKSELFTRSLMPAATGLAGDRSATQLMSADLHNLVHSDLPAPHVFYNDRTHTVHPSSPPGAPRIPATIATFHSPCLFPAVLDQAQLHPFGAIPHLSETHTSPVQRTQVISSAPEVSYSSTPAQDSDAWVAYVKSWSLDAASPNGILHSSRPAPNTLIHPFTDGIPVPEQTGDMVVQQPMCETLHPGRFDGVKSLDSSPLSNLVSYQPVCVGNTCCLHKPRKLMDPAVLHHRDNQLVTDNMVTCRPGHTEICKHAATLPPPATTDFDERGATLQATTNTMTSQRHTLNPIEAHFRSLTESGVSLQDTAENLADSGAITLTGSSSAFRKMSRFQRYFREAVSAVKSATRTKIFSQDEETSDEDEEVIGNQGIRLRSSRQARGRREFVQIKLIQEMKNEHTGAIWAMRFSPCGRLLATAGYDRSIRIWVLRQWYSYFRRMQQCASGPVESPEFGSSATFMNEADASLVDEENLFDSVSLASTSVSTTGKTDDGASTSSSTQACTDRLDQKSLPGVTPSVLGARVTSSSLKLPPDLERGRRTVFRSQPLLVYRGHEGVITEVAWSKNLFLLATSMDHQVRLWHISRRECLCLFSHNDTVPTIVFHPKDDRYFLSGSLDGKLRLWNIPDKKVRFWVEVPMPSALPVSNSGSASTGGFAASSFIKSSPLTPHISSGTVRNFNPRTIITCATFACEGTKVVVGTYDGRVMFFNSELTYITFIAIKSSTTKGRQCRVTAVELDPTDSNKILVTSNDSRLRLIDARDYHTLCKYRGFVNETSQIRASFSPTGRYLISGSENAFFYIWRKSLEVDRISRFSRVRKDRNSCWEAIKAHDIMVTVAVFSPNPNLVLDKQLRRLRVPGIFGLSDSASLTGTSHALRLDELPTNADPRHPTPYLGELVVSADCNGVIRVFKKQLNEFQSTNSVPK